MELLEKYQKLNESFDKSLVYRVGIDAGFFTELNNMIFMILYCLENHIRFELYSVNANFTYDKDWNDYFKSFSPQVCNHFHSIFNIHSPQLSWRFVLNELNKNRSTRMLKWKIKTDMIKQIAFLCKKLFFRGQFDFYTHDLYSNISVKNRHYSIPGFVEGDYIMAYNKVFDLIWKYNDEVQTLVDSLIKGLKLPKEYAACQIRGGDKYIEYDLLSVDLYIQKLRSITSLRDVFVLTDDINIYKTLLERAPEFRWYTLCDENQTGYFNSSFSKERSIRKKKQMIRFLASMTILDTSTVFLGTVTSAPSVTIGMRKYPNSHWIDYDPDEFYKAIDCTISEIGDKSRDFLKRKECLD